MGKQNICLSNSQKQKVLSPEIHFHTYDGLGLKWNLIPKGIESLAFPLPNELLELDLYELVE